MFSRDFLPKVNVKVFENVNQMSRCIGKKQNGIGIASHVENGVSSSGFGLKTSTRSTLTGASNKGVKQ